MPFDPVAFIERHPWTFAKTMPENPHEYIVRDNVQDDAGFDAMIRHIRQHGQPKVWRKRVFLYWEHGGRVYWTMGWPLTQTIIINRAELRHHEAMAVDPAVVTDNGHGRYRWSSHNGKRPEL
jgi:hypothetical protein